MLKKLNLYLIKPSNYDEDGYVIRHWRGVLPSNTLACLAGLTEDVLRGRGRKVALGGFEAAMQRQREEARKSWK